jgi:hypothetical protein
MAKSTEKDDRVSMTVRVPPAVYEAVAIHCIKSRSSHQELLTEGLEHIIKKHKIEVSQK